MYIPNFIMLYISLKTIILNIRKIFLKKYIGITILFILMLFSCILANNAYEAFFGSNLEGVITHISYFGFFCCALKLTNEKENIKIINLLLLVATLISILCLCKFDFIYKLFNIQKESYYFYIGPFYHFNHFGYYLLICNICSIFMFILNKKTKKIIYYIINFILLYTLVINDTFGVYISYILVLALLLIYFIYKKQNLKEILIILLSFILVSCISFRDNHNVVYRNFKELINDTSQIVQSESVEQIYNIGTDRGILWIKTVKLISNKPFIGYGFENIRDEYSKLEIMTDKPHNIILEQALNMGIPAMIIYMTIIILIIIKQLKRIKTIKPFYLMSLIIVISYLFSSMFGNQTFYVAPYFYIFLGLIAQNYYKEKEYEVWFINNNSNL